MRCENCYETVAEMVAAKDAEIARLNAVVAAMTDTAEEANRSYIDHHNTIQSLRQQLADTQRKLEAAEKDDCAWTDCCDYNMPGTYEGDCGIVWTFTEGGLADNECIYCPRCGGKIIDAARVDKEV